MKYFVLLATLLIVAGPSYAEIYRWVDDQGRSHFTDVQPEGIKAEAVDLKINTYTAVEVTPLIERLGKEGTVVIYSAAWCGVCKQAEKYFRDNHIVYVSYDVEKSPRGRIDFKALGAKSVPVIIIGKKRINGFTVSTFDKVYKKEMQQDTAPVTAPVPHS